LKSGSRRAVFFANVKQTAGGSNMATLLRRRPVEIALYSIFMPARSSHRPQKPLRHRPPMPPTCLLALFSGCSVVVTSLIGFGPTALPRLCLWPFSISFPPSRGFPSSPSHSGKNEGKLDYGYQNYIPELTYQQNIKQCNVAIPFFIVNI